MPMISIGTSLTDVDTTAKYKLGAEFIESVDGKTSPTNANGERVWVYVQNGNASAFVVGEPVIRKASTTTKIGDKSTAASTASHQVIGAAQHAIAASSYGWVLKKGWGTILASAAGIAANSGITISSVTAGSFMAEVIGTNDGVGFAPTAIGAGVTGSAWINCPG